MAALRARRLRCAIMGPGVPETSLADLFSPFYRVGDARDRKQGGTGLGLAITERAVKLHGGQVRAENAPGGGLRVMINLPAKEKTDYPEQVLSIRNLLRGGGAAGNAPGRPRLRRVMRELQKQYASKSPSQHCANYLR